MRFMSLKEDFPNNKNLPYLHTAEKHFIFANKLLNNFENSYKKPVCVLIEGKDSELYKLGRLVHSLFLIKEKISLENIVPITSLEDIFHYAAKQDLGTDKNSICHIVSWLSMELGNDESKNVGNALIKATLRNILKKDCSIINYVAKEVSFVDKYRFFTSTGYSVEALDIREMETYTREDHLEELQGLEFILSTLLWGEMIDNSKDFNHLQNLISKSISILSSRTSLEELNYEDFLSK